LIFCYTFSSDPLEILYIGQGNILDNSNRAVKLINAVNNRENNLMKSGLLRYYFGLVLPIFMQLPLTINGQQIKIDSLQLALKYANEDSNRINILNEISDAITWQGYFSKSDSFAFMALDLGQKIHFKKGVADAANNIGINYYYQDNYAKALHQYFNGYKIADSIGYKKGMATALLGIGEVYQDEGDDSSTLKEDTKSYKLYQDIGYELGMADVLIDMGWSYNNLEKDSAAFEKGEQAIQLYEKVGNKGGVAAALDLMGKVYEDRGDNSNALQNYAQSLSLKREIEDKDGVATSLVYVAEIYLKEKKLKDALENANNSIAASREINSSNDVMEAERVLSDIYLAEGSIGEAMEHYKNYTHLQDSIYGPKNTKKVVQAQLNYEYEIKQAQEKVEREKEEAIYKARIQFQSILLICLLVIVGLLIFLYNRLRLIKKQKDDIIKQKDDIIAKNELIERIEKWMIDDSGDFNIESKKLTEKIEFAIRKNVFEKIRNEFGERWWKDGVPIEIQKDAAITSIEKGNQEPPENFVYLLGYRKIIDKHWDIFKELYSDPEFKTGKEKQLKWFDYLNEIRNKLSHPGRAKVTEFEFDFLKKLSEWLLVRIAEIQ